jgi:hypothetical protein
MIVLDYTETMIVFFIAMFIIVCCIFWAVKELDCTMKIINKQYEDENEHDRK